MSIVRITTDGTSEETYIEQVDEVGFTYQEEVLDSILNFMVVLRRNHPAWTLDLCILADAIGYTLEFEKRSHIQPPLIEL